MSTRCNIVVSIGMSKLYLYRHHDGYLAETGADLAEKLKAVAGKPGARMSPEGMADEFLKALLAEKYAKASYEKEPRSVYEVTNDFHGDIERCYWIYFGRGGLMSENEENFTIMYAARPRDYRELGRWIEASKSTFKNLAEFVAAVNGDRESCNRRLRELKAESKFYADSSEYPMLEAS